MDRRRFLARGALAVGATCTPNLLLGTADAAPTSSTGSLAANLDDDASRWSVYIDPPGRQAGYVIDNVANPSRDGKSLQVGIRGGNPYTGIQAYTALPPAPSAVAFEMEFWWTFSPTTWNNNGGLSVVQAVELAMNLWTTNQRFEWGLQWENVSDGTSQAGQAPSWRLWTGTGWLNVGPSQELAGNSWHYFLLQGDIFQGEVRYVRFVSDNVATQLGQQFASRPFQGNDSPVVAFQLDGNYEQQPYDCFFDTVSLKWFTVSPWAAS